MLLQKRMKKHLAAAVLGGLLTSGMFFGAPAYAADAARTDASTEQVQSDAPPIEETLARFVADRAERSEAEASMADLGRLLPSWETCLAADR